VKAESNVIYLECIKYEMTIVLDLDTPA